MTMAIRWPTVALTNVSASAAEPLVHKYWNVPYRDQSSVAAEVTVIDAWTAETWEGAVTQPPAPVCHGRESLLRNEGGPDGLAPDDSELHSRTPSQQLMSTPKSGRITPRA